MKLITAFGLSALLLLSVSTILIAKYNRTDLLTQGHFECLGVEFGYSHRFPDKGPFLAYFTNTCQQPKKFLIFYKDIHQEQIQYETGCLLSGTNSGAVGIGPEFKETKFEVQTSNCD